MEFTNMLSHADK